MPQYAALIYVEDLDWTVRPDQAETTKQYAEFGAENAAADPRRRRAVPDLDRDDRARPGRPWRRRRHQRRPYAETKEVLGGFYLLEAADLDEAIAPRRADPRRLGPGGGRAATRHPDAHTS